MPHFDNSDDEDVDQNNQLHDNIIQRFHGLLHDHDQGIDLGLK